MCSQNLPCAPPGEVREAWPQGCPSKPSFPEGEGCWTLAAGAEWAWLGAHPSPLHTEKHPLLPMAVSECPQPLSHLSQQDHQGAFSLWSPLEPLTQGFSPQKRQSLEAGSVPAAGTPRVHHPLLLLLLLLSWALLLPAPGPLQAEQVTEDQHIPAVFP